MKTYSVKDIAVMLHTNPETVRRWIRSGKLKADRSSRKEGNMIREDELYRFLRSTTKYAAFAANLAVTNPLLSLTSAVGASVFGMIALTSAIMSVRNEHDARLLSDYVEQTLKKNITESEATIERKKAAIAELQAEIDKEQNLIKDYKAALEQLTEAVLVVSENKTGEVID